MIKNLIQQIWLVANALGDLLWGFGALWWSTSCLDINDSNNTCTCLKQGHISFYFYMILNTELISYIHTEHCWQVQNQRWCLQARWRLETRKVSVTVVLHYLVVTSHKSSETSERYWSMHCQLFMWHVMYDVHLSSRTSCSYFRDLLREEVII